MLDVCSRIISYVAQSMDVLPYAMISTPNGMPPDLKSRLQSMMVGWKTNNSKKLPKVIRGSKSFLISLFILGESGCQTLDLRVLGFVYQRARPLGHLPLKDLILFLFARFTSDYQTLESYQGQTCHDCINNYDIV